MFYTYAHTKPDGTIFYIGKGKDRRAWSKEKRNPHWHNITSKYTDYGVEILANWDTEEEAFDHEKLLISCFRDMGYKLANVTDGGEGSAGYKFTEEQIKKVSGVNNPWYGVTGSAHPAYQRPHSEETKEVLRQHSLKNGAVERCIQMARDPEMIEKRRQKAIGRKCSDDAKKRMSDAKKHKMRSFTVCGVEFESIIEFAKATNSYTGTVRRWLDANQFDKLEERYNASMA
jgi:hypothetical protein